MSAVRLALLLTAYDRTAYLAEVLRSWAAVPELSAWRVRFAIEPSPVQHEVVGLVRNFVARTGLADVEVVVNARRYGVLDNPYRHLAAMFADGCDFVVRAEDDLVVSDDVLRLLAHVAEAYAGDPAVATAYAFSDDPDPEPDPAALRRRTAFCPWVWGTWRDRWTHLIGPTWDRDYSTWNVFPGHEAGWDWNLNTRVLPAHGLVSVAPVASRVRNIGVVGVHGTPDNHRAPGRFAPHYDVAEYGKAEGSGELLGAEPQRVRDDGDAGQGHRGGGDDG